MTDRARLEAMARAVCSRLALCDEDELRMFDVLLDQLENERDGSTERGPVIDRLRNDRFHESEGKDAIDMAYRRGWNAGSRHAEAIVRVEVES